MISQNKYILIFLVILSLTMKAHGQALPQSPPASATPTPDAAAKPVAGVDIGAAPEAEELPQKADDALAEAASVDEGDKLRTPDSPAFSLLGVSPTEVAKPTTPRALAVALSKFVNKEAMLRIPEGLAIEIAPYWLFRHNRLDLNEYSKVNPWQLLRNLSVSFATTSTDDEGAIAFAAGARTHYALDKASISRCNKYNEAVTNAVENAEDTATKKYIDDIQSRNTHNGRRDEVAIRKELAAKKEEVKEQVKALAAEVLDSCVGKAAARKHVLSVAAALSWKFPKSEAESGELASQAYWATYSHRKGSAVFLVMGRLRLDEADRGRDGFVDLGARAILSRKTYAASLEGIGRWHVLGDNVSGSEPQYRLALQLEYLMQKGTWVSASFGRDFAAADAGALFTLANLTTSFGEAQIK